MEGGERRLSHGSMDKLGMISKEHRADNARIGDPARLWGVNGFEAEE